MSSLGCRTSSRCVDARVPVRATYVNLYRWPESDAEFVKSVAGGGGGGGVIRRSWVRSPAVVDSYSCRQMYLRSYTFSKEKEKESVPEKTRRCLAKLKERALIYHRRKSSDLIDNDLSRDWKKTAQRKTNKKGCVVAARKLREVSFSAFHSVFWRLLSCTTNAGSTARHPQEQ
ncbi:uncharacterized protein LOC103702822 [Phoenix dactylifera]|uniref:Uncharacterized protein LOC103702822 n=1 Tax=Phoenix dactylifera TaxID=42345 RepID=A0A8B7BR76_PHODC|nr:uncharacterized protein LOC103702822 [Phoenix dactylifera]